VATKALEEAGLKARLTFDPQTRTYLTDVVEPRAPPPAGAEPRHAGPPSSGSSPPQDKAHAYGGGGLSPSDLSRFEEEVKERERAWEQEARLREIERQVRREENKERDTARRREKEREMERLRGLQRGMQSERERERERELLRDAHADEIEKDIARREQQRKDDEKRRDEQRRREVESEIERKQLLARQREREWEEQQRLQALGAPSIVLDAGYIRSPASDLQVSLHSRVGFRVAGCNGVV